MGLKYPHLEEILRDMMLDEARRAWRARGVGEPNISQLSITTGINRKAVTAKVRQLVDPLPDTDVSAAARTFTRWLKIASAKPEYRRLPIVAEGRRQSFERLAREGSRGNVHHRTILDELLRLDMVTQSDGHVELHADGFVPAADLQTMLAFLGDNSRDHLLAAVSNILEERPPMLERAVYASGVTMQDCDDVHQLVKQRWSKLHLELTKVMTHAVEKADDSASARIRVGIYTYYEDAREDPRAIEGKR